MVEVGTVNWKLEEPRPLPLPPPPPAEVEKVEEEEEKAIKLCLVALPMVGLEILPKLCLMAKKECEYLKI